MMHGILLDDIPGLPDLLLMHFRWNYSFPFCCWLLWLSFVPSFWAQVKYHQFWDMPAPGFAQLMEKRGNWTDHAPFLLRYYSPRLNAVAREMAERGHEEQKPYAIQALMQQCDDRPATRALVRDLLRERRPEIREAAAEYFRWHGAPEDLEDLLKFYRNERDDEVKAVIRAAGQAIERRQRIFSGEAPAPEEQLTEDSALSIEDATAALREEMTWANRQQALRVLRVQPQEPPFGYKSTGGEPVQKAAIARAELLLRVTALHPEILQEDWETGLGAGAGAPEEPPAVSRLVVPIRDYFKRHGRSYGVWISTGASPFAGSYHIGDDVAWWADGAPVVAIGEGIVRYARNLSPSWGGIVVIEHVTPRGRRFCSLYAHLGPLLGVAEGQIVQRGELVGTLGRGFTAFNGGYVAHLHFGIHEGAFWQPGEVGAVIPIPDQKSKSWTRAEVTEVTEDKAKIRLQDSGEERTVERSPNWITGYMGKDRFDNGHHRWINPDEFLQKFTSRTVEL